MAASTCDWRWWGPWWQTQMLQPRGRWWCHTEEGWTHWKPPWKKTKKGMNVHKKKHRSICYRMYCVQVNERQWKSSLIHCGLNGMKSKLRLYYTCINFLTEAVSNPVGMRRQSGTGNYTAAFSKNKLHLEICFEGALRTLWGDVCLLYLDWWGGQKGSHWRGMKEWPPTREWHWTPNPGGKYFQLMNLIRNRREHKVFHC